MPPSDPTVIFPPAEMKLLGLCSALLSWAVVHFRRCSVLCEGSGPMLVGRAELCVGDSHPSISSWLFQAQWVRRSQFYYSHLHPAWSALQTATTGITVYYRSADRKSQGCVLLYTHHSLVVLFSLMTSDGFPLSQCRSSLFHYGKVFEDVTPLFI